MKGARKCLLCGHIKGYARLLPSEAHEAWFNFVQDQAYNVKAALRLRGVILPITDPVSVNVQIYREKATGDACGFYQAIGDLLQAVGIIKDDRLIEDWDGSRRLKDADDPRVEVFITVLEERPVQEELLTA